MAWTPPRTNATGDILTAPILNQQVRDNSLAVSTHTHSGAAGDGSASLAPTSITYPNQGSDPAAPGSGKLITFEAGDLFKSRAGVSGAVKTYSTTDHTHTLQSQGTSATANGTEDTLSNIVSTYTSYATAASITYTPATDASGIGVVAHVAGHVASSHSGTVTIRITAGGSEVVTSSVGSVGDNDYWQCTAAIALISPTEASTVFAVQVRTDDASHAVVVQTGHAGIALVDFDSG